MKIAQTCQGDSLANLDPNVKKQQKYVMQTQVHGTAFRRLDYCRAESRVRSDSCDCPQRQGDNPFSVYTL